MKEEREKLIAYFREMQGLEESTRDYYKKVSLDRDFDDQEVKDTFERISEDEQKHADIIGRVIVLIENNV